MLDQAAKLYRQNLHFARIESDTLGRAARFPFCIVGIGSESEADHAFITFFRRAVKLGETRMVADHDGQDSGGQRIERAQMPDRALAQNAAHAIDHIMRGQSGGLIDDENTVHGRIW